MTLLVTIVAVYLAASVALAISRIQAGHAFEKATSDVPIGDMEFFERPILFDRWTVVFYPAKLIIHSWMAIVRAVNTVIDRP